MWLIRVFVGRDEAGKRKYLSRTIHGTKKQADTQLRAWLTKRDAGESMTLEMPKAEPSASPMLADHLAAWLNLTASPRVREATLRGYTWMIDIYIVPDLGTRRLDELEADFLIIQNFYATLTARGLSPRTVRYVHSVLSSSLRAAVEAGLIPTNPCSKCTLPRKNATEMQYFTAGEVKTFLAAAKDDRFYPLFLLAIETGTRPGEYLALQWKDIDLDAGTVSIRRSLKARAGGGFYFTEPKTKGSRRLIPISPTLANALRNHRRAQAENIMRRRDHYQDNGLVFPNDVGEPMPLENLRRRHFAKIVEEAELPAIRLYDLRHTMATLLLSAGVHPKVVSERLGHGSITLTMDVYSHVMPTMQQGATDSLERLMKG